MSARKPYTPDFAIKQNEKVAYIEHFGISENGQNDRFSTKEAEAYMLKTKGQYPVLHPTYNGIHYDEQMTVNQLKQLKKYLERVCNLSIQSDY